MNDSGLTLYRQEKLQNLFKYILKNPKIDALLHIFQICPVGRIGGANSGPRTLCLTPLL